MNRDYLVPAIALAFAVIAGPMLLADVKTEEKSLVQFGGALGRVVNFFGGKAAKEGVISTVAVSGDRKMTANDTTGQIIDLKEENVYDLAMRKKTYTVTTFPKQLGAALAMRPGLKDAFARYNKASLDGTPILVTTTIDGVKSPEQMQQQQSSNQADQGAPTSVGGALGGFMRRRAQANAEKNPPSARSMFMTMNLEILKIATAVSSSDGAIPAGF